MAVTASNCDSSSSHKNSPILATTRSTHALPSGVTAGRANKAVMPLPIKAGVLGIDRTTLSLPNQAAMLSLRMPAATLKCNADDAKLTVCCAASLKTCGFTAQITKPAVASKLDGAARA